MQNEGVRHAHTMRLHWVALSVIKISDIRIIKIGDLKLGEKDKSVRLENPNFTEHQNFATHLLLTAHGSKKIESNYKNVFIFSLLEPTTQRLRPSFSKRLVQSDIL